MTTIAPPPEPIADRAVIIDAAVDIGYLTREEAEELPNTGKVGMPNAAPAQLGKLHLTDEEYFSIDARSNTEMGHSEFGPRSLLAHWVLPGTPPTPQMRVGTMAHEMLLLGTDDIATRYCLAPINNTKAGKGREYGPTTKAWAEADEEARAAGQVMVSREMMSKASAIARNVMRHREARALLELVGESEVTMMWTDEARVGNLTCKAKIDRLLASGMIVDIKTTRKVPHEKVAPWIVWDYKYHRQAAFYRLGVKEVTGDNLPFCWIFAMNEPPYEVAVYEAHEETLSYGLDAVRAGLGVVRRTLIERDFDFACAGEQPQLMLPLQVSMKLAAGEEP